MEHLNLLARLLLSFALIFFTAELSGRLGERLALSTTDSSHVTPRPLIQSRRNMMDRLAVARSLGQSDPLRGETALMGVFQIARDPQVRDQAAIYLLELAVNDWPSGYRRDFLTSIVPAALESARSHRLPPSVIVAQAVLESGWGRSTLASQHHNLFGVKAGPTQTAASLPTLEATAHGVKIIRASFRTFSTKLESIQAHGALIAKDDRYLAAREHSGNWRQFLVELAPIYASDPAYAGQITLLINRYGLDRWDGMVTGNTHSTTS
jgi:hypothetical protein